MNRDRPGAGSEAVEMNLEVDSKYEVMYYVKEWSVIFNEETVDRWERVVTIFPSELKRDYVVKIGRSSGNKNFVGKREVIFNAFSYVQLKFFLFDWCSMALSAQQGYIVP